MASTDPTFFACTAILLLIFYSLRSTLQQTAVLSLGSVAMYAVAGPLFLVLLLISCSITAACSFTAASEHRQLAKVLAIVGIVANLTILAVFKYKMMFVLVSARSDTGWMTLFFAMGLPIGISFYTFHGISLIVDAWRNPEVLRHRESFPRHLLDTSLYLSFFPQLIAGPITKGKMFFPQVIAKRVAQVEWQQAAGDIVIGLFLKRVVADNLNQFTLPLSDPSNFSQTPQANLLAMIFGYSAQIFADFAGYSLIAIGIARLFGYRLPDNFNRPYAAQSITDFWRRWHMSLSSWLKDYLYVPLGGSRKGVARTYRNLFLVMGLGGLWHCAGWNFAVWGLWHGVLLAIERFLGLREASGGPLAFVRIAVTFLLVSFGWLFFRLNHLGDIVTLAKALASPWRSASSTLEGPTDLLIVGILALIVLIVHLPAQCVRLVAPWHWRPSTRPYFLGALWAITMMSAGTPHAFIYFQF